MTTSLPTSRSFGPAAKVAGVLAAGALALTACDNDGGGGGDADGELTEVVIAEPFQSIGYLPLYLGIAEGIFEEHGLDVSVYTASDGGGHVNAVLTDQAWGFIGGPEHNGYVRAEDDSGTVEIKAISAVVNRGNVHLVAADGAEEPDIEDWDDVEEFLSQGPSMVTGAYGGTENAITRYLIQNVGLEIDDMENVIEAGDHAARLTIVSEGEAEYAFSVDPVMQEGINEGIWGEPVINVPEFLGEYAYSTVNVPVETYENDPETAQALVDGFSEALATIHEDPDTAFEVATAEFSNLDEDLVQDVLDRQYEIELWGEDAYISEESVETSLEVVRTAQTLDDEDDPAVYDDLVDMRFVNNGD